MAAVLTDPGYAKFMAQVPNMLPDQPPEPARNYAKELEQWQAVVKEFEAKAEWYRREAAICEEGASMYRPMVTELLQLINKNGA